MGSRDDNIIDDTHADQALRRLIQHAPEQQALALPPDLVGRTLERLPTLPPSDVAQRTAARRQQRTLLWSVVLLLFGLVAAINIWNTIEGRPHATLMFGTGASDSSALLLGVQLAVKPLWNSMRALHPALLAAALLLACVGGIGLWRLLRQTRAKNVEDL